MAMSGFVAAPQNAGRAANGLQSPSPPCQLIAIPLALPTTTRDPMNGRYRSGSHSFTFSARQLDDRSFDLNITASSIAVSCFQK
jgi:hypothetical protein